MIKYGSVEIILQSDDPEDIDKIYEYVVENLPDADTDVDTFEIRKYVGGTVLKITLAPEPDMLEGIVERLLAKDTLRGEKDEIDALIEDYPIWHSWTIFNSQTGKWKGAKE